MVKHTQLFVGNLPTNYLSVFDYFMVLVLEDLKFQVSFFHIATNLMLWKKTYPKPTNNICGNSLIYKLKTGPTRECKNKKKKNEIQYFYCQVMK